MDWSKGWSYGTYNSNSQIKFKTTMLKYNLYYCSNPSILAKDNKQWVKKYY